MERLNSEDLKKIEFEILKWFDQVCKENGLTYYLCGGTLLGAVRHKGFIPWDDDIDLLMPRDSYERLVQLSKSFGRYQMLNDNSEDYGYCFGKIVDTNTTLIEYDLIRNPKNYGVYIDVFPLDGMPTEGIDEHFNSIQKKKKEILYVASHGVKMGKNIFAWWKEFKVWWPIRKKKLSELRREYSNIVGLYPFDNSDYVISGGSWMGKREIIPRSYFNGIDYLEFEGEIFPVMSEYKAVLEHYYDDYMQLPPIEKRVTHHRFKAYCK